MRSIKLRLIVMFTLVILAVTAALGMITLNVVRDDLIQTARADLEEMARVQAKYVTARSSAQVEYLTSLAQNPLITNPNATLEEKIAFFEQEAQRTNYQRFAIADKAGNAQLLTSSREINQVADREFFQTALKGEATMSDLLFSKLDDQPVVVYAAPIKVNGEIVGVLYGARDGLILSEITKDVLYKTTGYGYIVNNEGTTVGHKNTDLVIAKDNDIENAKTIPELKQLGALTEQMITRTVGTGEYTYNNVSKLVGYAPIENTPWIMALTVEQSEILQGVTDLTRILLILCVVVLVVGVAATYVISGRISKPIVKITRAAQEIADGTFNVTLDVKSNDEIGSLAEAFRLTIDRLVNYQGYIDEVSDCLREIAGGNLTIELHREYTGQFRQVKDNMQAMIERLNDTLVQINQSADQVNNHADQVAHGAQALSQGATEQASSVEELSASISETAEQIRRNAEHAATAHEKANFAGSELRQSNEQMSAMVDAMNEIARKSDEISKIIKAIDDIAFQTNILALNAAVEAARAGAAGKGFAVVADEVRNLAGKSAQAATDTTALIEETLVAVRNGSKMAEVTAKSLGESGRETGEAITLINRIAEDSKEQADSVMQINLGVEQISAVVQTNAATAEESAATSEELTAQSNLLKELLSHFRLRQTDRTAFVTPVAARKTPSAYETGSSYDTAPLYTPKYEDNYY
ncbi:MAG: methyl-accepting chemotaxis sensory transducer with Cache sensor [Firmicutes bacterium]|nr:methyl-accepting chemotaxis sensory transducer with Cache sensor [Bacillota bacterium]